MFASVNMMTEEKFSHQEDMRELAEDHELTPLIDNVYILEAREYVDFHET